jgi:mono/diheme cytochrome c family protein
MNKLAITGLLAAVAALGLTSRLPAQYPQRTVDPVAVERGRTLYVNNGCSFCHGAEIRGGDGGPSLFRAMSVLTDQRGETIGPLIKNGVPGTRMPPFGLTDAQIADIADFLHSFQVGGRARGIERPKSIIVGSPEAGRDYFQAKCASCHSPTGDLAGIATRVPDEMRLQHRWLAPPTKPVPAIVTLKGGEKVTGTVTRLDEFSIELKLPDGTIRTIERKGDKPRIEINNPLVAHEELLRGYADKDIHDTTAYLATLK